MNLAYNEGELAIVQKAAAQENQALGSWVAKVSLAVAAEQLVPVSVDARDVVEELITSRAELRRIGNNANQIARTLNSGGAVSEAQLSAVLERVEEAVKRVDAATLQVMRERRRS